MYLLSQIITFFQFRAIFGRFRRLYSEGAIKPLARSLKIA